MRRPTGGDPNRKALNLHHGVLVSDAFMRAVETQWTMGIKKSQGWNYSIDRSSKKFMDKIINSKSRNRVNRILFL